MSLALCLPLRYGKYDREVGRQGRLEGHRKAGEGVRTGGLSLTWARWCCRGAESALGEESREGGDHDSVQLVWKQRLTSLCFRMLLKTTDYLDHFARFKRKENVEAVERLLSAHKELAKFERAQLGMLYPAQLFQLLPNPGSRAER